MRASAPGTAARRHGRPRSRPGWHRRHRVGFAERVLPQLHRSGSGSGHRGYWIGHWGERLQGTMGCARVGAAPCHPERSEGSCPGMAPHSTVRSLGRSAPRDDTGAAPLPRDDTRSSRKTPMTATTTLGPIHAPTGSTLSCKGWHQEAALRMLMNNLDPEVAERPEDLVVYGGGGKAARNWECYERIVATLRRLENDETLLVQSGKPVGVFRTHDEAPRVLIANAHLVPRWATWDEFRRLEALGLTMYGQMTAGSWIYIGTQGILQGTYETFAELRPAALRRHAGGPAGGDRRARRHGRGPAARGDDERRRVSRRGRGRVAHPSGGWTPATATGCETDLDARARAGGRRPAREAAALGGPGRQHRRGAARAGAARRACPTCVTDQTSAHDLRLGYIPAGCTLERGGRAAGPRPGGLRGAGARLDGGARAARCWQLQSAGRGGRSTTATTCAARWPITAGMARRVRDPGLRAGVHPAAVLPGRGAVPLGGAVGRSRRHRRHRRRRAGDVPEEGGAGALDRGRRSEKVAVPGPAGAHLLAGVRRAGRDGAASSTGW